LLESQESLQKLNKKLSDLSKDLEINRKNYEETLKTLNKTKQDLKEAYKVI
jgi:hypothetical protein